MPPTNQFGVNPQSNPFLNTAAAAATPSVASTTAASGGLDLFAAASGGNQSNFAQVNSSLSLWIYKRTFIPVAGSKAATRSFFVFLWMSELDMYNFAKIHCSTAIRSRPF